MPRPKQKKRKKAGRKTERLKIDLPPAEAKRRLLMPKKPAQKDV